MLTKFLDFHSKFQRSYQQKPSDIQFTIVERIAQKHIYAKEYNCYMTEKPNFTHKSQHFAR